jgi:hypothetical protein
MERITSNTSRPFLGDFVAANVDNKLLLGDIGDGEAVGLWIKRKLDMEKIKEDQNNIAELDPEQDGIWIPVEKSKQDSVDIKISWD